MTNISGPKEIALNHGTLSTRTNYRCNCPPCKAAYTRYQRVRRAHRPDVVERGRTYSREHKRELRKYLNSLKDDPCTDCGIKYPPYVMQFDHLDPALKSFGVSRIPSKSAIDVEAAKCELVCANCHAIRTHGRRPAAKPDKYIRTKREA